MPIPNSAKFDTDALDYAEHLIEQCRDTAWEEDMRQHRDTAATQNAVDKFSALFEKGLNDQQRQYLLELGEQMFDPINILRGHMADALRGNALALLPRKQRVLIGRTPVCLLPSRRLNGFAARSPRGKHVIVLDSSTLWFNTLVVRIVEAYTASSFKTYSSPEPPRLELSQALRALVHFAVTGDMTIVPYFAWIGSGGHYRLEVAPSAMTLFVLLHEYGHILLGHLSEDATNCAAVSSNQVPIVEYSRDQLAEFEADLFAYRVLRDGLLRLGSRTDYALVKVGFLLNFFALCELVAQDLYGASPGGDTHPPAIYRWQRLLDTELSTLPKTSAAPDLAKLFWAMVQGQKVILTGGE